MTNIIDILNEFNSSNSRLHKQSVLEKYKDNRLFIDVFQHAYDKVKYSYGITCSQVNYEPNEIIDEISLEECIKDLKLLCDRTYTGNNAIRYLENLFNSLNPDNKKVLKCIIDRDLRIGVGVKEFNKIVSDSDKIFELPYMRCSLMDKVKNISYPAYLQVKMDGTFRTFIKNNNRVDCYSRSGESYEYPYLFKIFEKLPDGAYIGELLVPNAKDRYESNGILNSLSVPDELDFYMWDYLELDEFSNCYSDTPYVERFSNLSNYINTLDNKNLKLVKSVQVSNINEVISITKKWIEQGEEGGVLKDLKTKFENKTSKYQIKIKPEFDVDVKITGFTKGNGKRADKVGAVMFESSDGLVVGQCSGFDDLTLDYITNNQDELLGRIMSVIATALSKSKNSDTYSLLHPRFKELRQDKLEADDYQRILEISKSINI